MGMVSDAFAKNQRLVVGVTGRMSSGKTTFCQFMKVLAHEYGIPLQVLDVDTLRRKAKIKSDSREFIPFLKAVLTKAVRHSQGIVLIEWAMLVEQGLLPVVEHNVIHLICKEVTLWQRLWGGDLSPIEQLARLKRQYSNQESARKIKSRQVEAGRGIYLPINNEDSYILEKAEATLQTLILHWRCADVTCRYSLH